MVKAILFDADNTLYESRCAARAADLIVMNFLSKVSGIEAGELLKEWESIVEKLKKSRIPEKRHRLYSYSLLLKKIGLEEEISTKMYEVFLEEFLKRIELFDGVEDVLKKLKKKGFKLVVVSEDFKEQLLLKLDVLGISELFNLIVSCDDVGSMKPSEKYYKIVKSELKLPYKEMVVVGDSFERDLKIPKRLGMKCVLVFGKEREADFCIRKFSQLAKVIDEIQRRATNL